MERDFYICNTCKNIITKLKDSKVPVVCCGEKMTKLIPGTVDASAEKHIPTVEIENENRFVRLKHHPMVPEHYIQFIEVYPKDKSRMYLKYLSPNEPAEFEITHFEENIEALEHCNIHGLWSNCKK